MDYGNNIKLARKEAGLTQEQLAKKCGVATITIRQYESGKRQPRFEQLQEIAIALGVSADYLMTGGLHVSQTHLENGVHIYKSARPFDVASDFLRDYQDLEVDIPYQDEYLIIAIDKNSTLTDDEVRDLVEIYRPEQKNGMSEEMRKIAAAFDRLNIIGQEEAIKRIEELAEIPKYQKGK